MTDNSTETVSIESPAQPTGAFADRLLDAVLAKRAPVVVGLDPQLERFPKTLRPDRDCQPAEAADCIIELNKRVIDAIHDLVPAVKPQIAFYERLGLEGLRAYAATVEHAKQKGLLVIADVKRGDIGSTAAAYADAHLGQPAPRSGGHPGEPDLHSHAATINPYLGSDSVAPFLEKVRSHGKGLFVLVKTSNPSSGELQDLVLATPGGQRALYEAVAALVDRWGQEAGCGRHGYSGVGAVVAATYPRHARSLRAIMPHAIFLVPGYGAQGGSADDVIPCFDSRGLGAVVSASRSVLYAWSKQSSAASGAGISEDFALHSRRETQRMINDINQALERSGRSLGR